MHCCSSVRRVCGAGLAGGVSTHRDAHAVVGGQACCMHSGWSVLRGSSEEGLCEHGWRVWTCVLCKAMSGPGVQSMQGCSWQLRSVQMHGQLSAAEQQSAITHEQGVCTLGSEALIQVCWLKSAASHGPTACAASGIHWFGFELLWYGVCEQLCGHARCWVRLACYSAWVTTERCEQELLDSQHCSTVCFSTRGLGRQCGQAVCILCAPCTCLSPKAS